MRLLPLLLALGTTLGCRLAPFDELEGDATVIALEPGNGYPTGSYGAVLTTYEAVLADGTAVSRVAVSAGAGTPFAVHDAWDGELGTFARRFKGCDDIATDMPDCDPGASAALAFLPQWMGRRDCLVQSAINVGIGTSPGEGQLRIKCESTASGTTALTRVPDIGFGTSLASLPADNALGPLLVGAPRGEGVGQLYRLPPDGISAVAIPLPELGLSTGAALGTAIATAALPDASAFELDSDAVVVAVAAPGANRVVVLAVGLFTDPIEGGPAAVTARAIGCLDGSPVRAPSAALEAGFGLAVGDVTGDGVPEVFVGQADAVRMLRLSEAGAGEGCGGADASDDPTTTTIACPTTTTASCESFGAAIAVGDADADGTNDLLVGAPRSTTPEGQSGAGFVLRGTVDGPTLDGAHALYVAGVGDGALLGEEVAFVRTGTPTAPRFEPVLGAPGHNRVYTFLCSGLPNDTADQGGRCQPL